MPDEVAARPTLPAISKELLDTIGAYGMARTDRLGEPEILHRWQKVLIGIKRYAHAHSEERARAEIADARRYRAFFDAGLPITYLGVEYRTKADLDAAIDATIPSISLAGTSEASP